MTEFRIGRLWVDRKRLAVLRRVGLIAVLLCCGLGRCAFAQPADGSQPEKMMAADAHPNFDVATIKPSDPNDSRRGFHTDGRHLFYENETMESLISFAFNLHWKQIAGGPDWMDSELFDVRGVPDIDGVPNAKQQQEMLQKLLIERFGLKFHWEKREMGVYALTVGRGAPKLKKSEGAPNGLSDTTFTHYDRELVVLQVTNATMEEFASTMQSSSLDKPAVDETGLKGRWDFILKWTPDDAQPGDPNAPPGLFTAMQEQLGLKLEPVKAPADVLVVDKVERPSAN